MSAKRGNRSNRWVFLRSMVTVVAVGLVLTACQGDVVPDETEPPREIELALDDQSPPELSDQGVGTEPGETVEHEPHPAPPPPSSPVRRAPPQAPPAAPESEESGAEEQTPETTEPEMRYVTLTATTGSEFEIELLDKLSTGTNQPGDKFEASVTQSLIDGGTVMVPVNSIVRGEVTAVQRSGGSGQEAIIKIKFLDVFFNGEAWPLSASVVQATPQSEGTYTTADKAARIGAGAVAGAILGRVIGGNSKGTVIGAAVGAAAGTAITLATEDADAVLEEGSILRLRIDEPLVIRIPDPMGG